MGHLHNLFFRYMQLLEQYLYILIECNGGMIASQLVKDGFGPSVLVETLVSPDDKMVAFLESPTDSYAILQLREDVEDNIPLMFANYSYLQKKEMEPEIDRYEVVYHGSISMSGDVDRQLEDLYVKFNIDHPNDFRGHSMSVSDIVALKVAGEVSFHYVDSVGFQKLENFMKSENYLKNAEMAMEDDYGMIDGIINNGKAPGLEERPSVLEQLKEKPVPDVAHKPPKSHPEREIE